MTQLVLSLFPNIGLLDLAFEQEWPDACIVRGPDLIFNELSDVRAFHPPAGRFDGIIGGPPCQSFSSLVHLVRARGNQPRYPNLIPEYERCVAESQADWFLMENVPAAPAARVEGYVSADFILDYHRLDSGDGIGNEQMRSRRFTFGRRISGAGSQAPDLRQWIRLAALVLPKCSPTVTQCAVNNDTEAKGRLLKSAVIGHSGATPHQRLPARHLKHTVVGGRSGITAESEARRYRSLKNAVVGGHGKSLETVRGGGAFKRYDFAEACRLQGLPENFLAHAPWLMDAKRDVVAAGVPLPMGRAIARAVRQALGLPLVEREEQPA